MERLFRGCIIVRADESHDEALENWRKFEAAGFEFVNDEDTRLFSFLQGHVTRFVEMRWDPEQKRERQMCSMPDLAMLSTFFEQSEQIDVVNRLQEIAKVQRYIHQNYGAILKDQRKKQDERLFSRLCSKAVNSVAKIGPAAAMADLQGELRKLESAIAVDPFEAYDVSLPQSPIKYLLKHYRLAEGRPSGLVGYAGSAKTFLAAELALSVAAGRKTAWGGCELSLSGAVVHLDYEMGKKMSSRRYQRVAHGLGVDVRQLVEDKLFQYVPHPRVNLTTPGVESTLKRLTTGKALLIIDSFRAATPDGNDENSSAFRTYLDLLSRVSDETGVIVLVIHHERKSQPGGEGAPKMQQMRGSSGLADAFGATVHIEPKDSGFNIVQGKVSAGRTGASKRCQLVDIGLFDATHDDTEGLRIDEVSIDQDERDKPFREVENALRAISQHKIGSATGLTKVLSEMGLGTRKERVLEIFSQLKEENRIALQRGRWVTTDHELNHGLTVEDCL